jgi:hypothetical protein
VTGQPGELRRTSAQSRPAYSPGSMRGSEPLNLADLLDRVLDKGVVIAGDIRLYLGGIELITIKIRLLIASIDKAQEIGITWWETDPSLYTGSGRSAEQDDEISRRLARIEESIPGLEPWEAESVESEPALSAQNRELRRQRDELRERLDRLEAALAERDQSADQEPDKPGKGQSRKKND